MEDYSKKSYWEGGMGEKDTSEDFGLVVADFLEGARLCLRHNADFVSSLNQPNEIISEFDGICKNLERKRGRGSTL